MGKLSETQLTILSQAAQREDGAGEVPAGMKGAAAGRTGASLVAQKLMREIRSKPDMPVWRKDEKGRPLSLVLLRAGRDAAEAKVAPSQETEPTKDRPTSPKVKVNELMGAAPQSGSTGGSTLPRAGSKQAAVVEMLSREGGTTLEALMKVTGWLRHTTRAALTGLRKRGFGIERTHDDRLGSVYRIAIRKAA